MDYTKKMLESFDFKTLLEKNQEMWTVVMGGLTWSQEQTGKLLSTYMQRNNCAYQEAMDYTKKIAENVVKNQQQFYSLIKEYTIEAFENIKVPMLNNIDELARKINELEKKLEEK